MPLARHFLRELAQHVIVPPAILREGNDKILKAAVARYLGEACRACGEVVVEFRAHRDLATWLPHPRPANLKVVVVDGGGGEVDAKQQGAGADKDYNNNNNNNNSNNNGDNNDDDNRTGTETIAGHPRDDDDAKVDHLAAAVEPAHLGAARMLRELPTAASVTGLRLLLASPLGVHRDEFVDAMAARGFEDEGPVLLAVLAPFLQQTHMPFVPFGPGGSKPRFVAPPVPFTSARVALDISVAFEASRIIAVKERARLGARGGATAGGNNATNSWAEVTFSGLDDAGVFRVMFGEPPAGATTAADGSRQDDDDDNDVDNDDHNDDSDEDNDDNDDNNNNDVDDMTGRSGDGGLPPQAGELASDNDDDVDAAKHHRGRRHSRGNIARSVAPQSREQPVVAVPALNLELARLTTATPRAGMSTRVARVLESQTDAHALLARVHRRRADPFADGSWRCADADHAVRLVGHLCLSGTDAPASLARVLTDGRALDTLLGTDGGISALEEAIACVGAGRRVLSVLLARRRQKTIAAANNAQARSAADRAGAGADDDDDDNDDDVAAANSSGGGRETTGEREALLLGTAALGAVNLFSPGMFRPQAPGGNDFALGGPGFLLESLSSLPSLEGARREMGHGMGRLWGSSTADDGTTAGVSSAIAAAAAAGVTGADGTGAGDDGLAASSQSAVLLPVVGHIESQTELWTMETGEDIDENGSCGLAAGFVGPRARAVEIEIDDDMATSAHDVDNSNNSNNNNNNSNNNKNEGDRDHRPRTATVLSSSAPSVVLAVHTRHTVTAFDMDSRRTLLRITTHELHKRVSDAREIERAAAPPSRKRLGDPIHSSNSSIYSSVGSSSGVAKSAASGGGGAGGSSGAGAGAGGGTGGGGAGGVDDDDQVRSIAVDAASGGHIIVALNDSLHRLDTQCGGRAGSSTAIGGDNDWVSLPSGPVEMRTCPDVAGLIIVGMENGTVMVLQPPGFGDAGGEDDTDDGGVARDAPRNGATAAGLVRLDAAATLDIKPPIFMSPDGSPRRVPITSCDIARALTVALLEDDKYLRLHCPRSGTPRARIRIRKGTVAGVRFVTGEERLSGWLLYFVIRILTT
jgi:hypothetical protein